MLCALQCTCNLSISTGTATTEGLCYVLQLRGHWIHWL
jgi:hypothetical protein